MGARKPPRLKPGATIGVIAPAGCVEPAALELGVEVIRKEGFKVELAPNIGAAKGYLAGDERTRAKDLESFFQRPDIGAILCARGGFGSMQIIPHINRSLLSQTKIFAGYSDITILLNWLLQGCGMVTFHAPMVAMDLARGMSQLSREQFWGLLTGKENRYQMPLREIIRPGQAEGEMLGGCLSLVVTTLGTPYEVDTAGRILFLEDIGEKPYRVERMLTHLKAAGKLANLAGLVFGDFTGCEGEGSRDIRQVIMDLFESVSYPVVMGLAAGHGPENLTLPFGVKMSLSADEGVLSILESPVV
jgi:muramoyltetrapeptide carboxypeptidase